MATLEEILQTSDEDEPEENIINLDPPEEVEFVETVGNAEEINEHEEGNQDEDGDENKNDKKEKKVKIIRNPQPKLDVDRLRGPRGICMIQTVFKDVKFKGKGHEEEDLCVLMKNYEYWCHRMFPKFPFDDCVERMEKLGHKKLLKSFLNKIRLGLVEDEDATDTRLLNNDSSDEENAFDSLIDDSDALTEEQLRCIEMNRERAQRLRQEMLNKNKTVSENTNEIDASQNSDMNDIFDDVFRNREQQISKKDGANDNSNLNLSQMSEIFNLRLPGTSKTTEVHDIDEPSTSAGSPSGNNDASNVVDCNINLPAEVEDSSETIEKTKSAADAVQIAPSNFYKTKDQSKNALKDISNQETPMESCLNDELNVDEMLDFINDDFDESIAQKVSDQKEVLNEATNKENLSGTSEDNLIMDVDS